MLEVIAWPYERVRKMQKKSGRVLADPVVLINGCMAGALGRAAALPLDMGGIKGPMQTIARRAPQWGIFLWLYVPLSKELNEPIHNPPFKMFSTFMLGAVAGWSMRFFTNPIGRVLDESMRIGKSPQEVCKIFNSKTVLQYFYTTPPLIANSIYFGTLMVAFEGLRRFLERNGVMVQNPLGVALINGIVGGAAAGVASTVCYPWSAHSYLQTVIHDSAICRGLVPTLMKEVPMAAVTFGSFTLLQRMLAGHHSPRGGFGY